MANLWGRSPRNRLGRDMQALVIWILIIGVAGYLIFPTFFNDIFSRMSVPAADTGNLAEVTLPDLNNSGYVNSQDYVSVAGSLSNGNNEVASGFWLLFVADGQFKQFSLTNESYTFLLRLIEDDQKAGGQNILFLTANGQIHKYLVSAEVYTIINNLETINNRTGGS